ncbi:putative tRNA (Guanosine(18)-2'-O)-methyltransferase [Heracleum sosnowskyi]|uniref:tRNA (guanosine(18)-2'-O)-methyltransferase TARBP1 n=1 Tax=Heracleum sosnowskyi TaxID=360622 RepID=A0AAD8GXI8_9APIA|nr:putative tRNA (Guanosine(18)-2'-O)-methyltransferase [Heracleum sosnowskyi]
METSPDSLSNCFRRVPPAAIPAMLDCIMSLTPSSPTTLFFSLLDAFPQFTKDIDWSEKLDSEHRNYVASYVSALCHLLKKSGDNMAAVRSFIWRILISLMKLAQDNNREVITEALGSFFDLVIETSSWGVVEATVVPYLLRSISCSMGMPQSADWAICTWTAEPVKDNEQLADFEIIEDYMPSHCSSFPLPLSCQLLTSLLDAAWQCKDAFKINSALISEGRHFALNLLWDLSNVIGTMLLHSQEHRSCAIRYLLPVMFKSFNSHCVSEIIVRGQTCLLSRKQFLMKTWNCCKTLFSLGSLERRDGYTMLSLYLSFFSSIEGCNTTGKEEVFDLRSEMEFWEEIKRGLVDKESLVRKQSLHILKASVLTKEKNQPLSGVSENLSSDMISATQALTKKGRWADKEAKSLGVGKGCNSADFGSDSQQKWDAFFLLYEMLEEYGTHLVEAAWNHQIALLLHISSSCLDSSNHGTKRVFPARMETLEEIFNWLAVLWDRGFCHDNPQVRCLIMESFLGIEWKNYDTCANLVPQDFILGPFIQGLNDPVHHKDFGLKGIYSSKTIEGAAKFLNRYTSYLSSRHNIAFLNSLASVSKKHSFGRAGLMSLAECIASAAYGNQTCNSEEVAQCVNDISVSNQTRDALEIQSYNDKEELLDVLRFVMESSKQHFNPNYRLKVCEKILHAAASVVSVFDVSLELLLHFITSLPQDSTNYGGPLRVKVQEWLWACDENQCTFVDQINVQVLKRLDDFPATFLRHQDLEHGCINYDDEDLEMWEIEAKRWARMLFLVIKETHHLYPTLMFMQSHSSDLCKQINCLEWLPVKFHILIMALINEFQVMYSKTAKSGTNRRSDLYLTGNVGDPNSEQASILKGKFIKCLVGTLENLISFAQFSSSILWSHVVIDNTEMPSSVRGRLGGPTQRRLSVSTTTVILQAIICVKSIASVTSCVAKLGSEDTLNSAFTYLWEISWNIIQSAVCNSETEAEICIGAFEALCYILKAIASVSSTVSLGLLMESFKSSSPKSEDEPLLDYLFETFLGSINSVIGYGDLVRSRRAVLMNWKWICLESLLSIPRYAVEKGDHTSVSHSLLSDAMARQIFGDLVESLENAGEGSVLPMLRSVRLLLQLFAIGRMGHVVSSCSGMDAQMMWNLVHSSWILHRSCNKRRVAPIAALLSSVLHHSVFNEKSMHEVDNAAGPLKWLVEKILEEGVRSPRTIRLAALHLTGLLLLYPNTIKYYIKELKLLTLYGSVAFDEDFKGELTDNVDARSEVSVLAISPDPELTEVFINTELYARVSVAVLFYKLANLVDMSGSNNDNEMGRVALEAGKIFLLELLDSAVNDKDLGKELYKKYSAIHRRKVRVWQMICILSRFVDQDVVHKVTCILHIALQRNNIPGVRQYMETFAIFIYLKFPSLVGEQLALLLRDYDMRSQSLSSYVFIAANVILHSTEVVRYKNLNELLPPVIPLLTSHHHTLRGFTQLLVHQVLSKSFPALNCSTSETLSLEKKCFLDLKSFLESNSDCSKLRSSMEGYLSDFNPEISASPVGIFSNRVDEVEFECVPKSLMERVIDFLNDVREDLRFSMAKDAAAIKNENFQVNGGLNHNGNANKEALVTHLRTDMLPDFQKKVTFSKNGLQDVDSHLLGNSGTYESLVDMESEEQLLNQVLQSRSLAAEKSKEGRQQIILVASLLDRIPNLAGLMRTCEVFKASALAIGDANVLNDKQFQLISVTAEKWVPIIEVPTSSVKLFLEKKQQDGFSILGLEQTANSIPLDKFVFPKKSVVVLGREKEGIPVELIHILDACIEIPQLGIVRSLNVHVSGAIALWEYTRQQRSQ